MLMERGCEALPFHVDGMTEDGQEAPTPRSAQEIKADPELADWRRGADFATWTRLHAPSGGDLCYCG